MALRVYHVAREPDGWSVKAEGDDRPPQVLPNKLAAVSAARRMARASGNGDVVVHRPDGRIESVESLAKGHLEDVLHLHETEKSEGLLADLSARSGESPGDIILKALALYKAAMEAVEEGKAVGIASDSGHLEREFVGF